LSNVIADAGVGSGALTKTGAGTLILTAGNTYTGGTTISAGTLQLGDGGASGSIVGDVLNNGTLAFNRVDGSIFAGTISGSGSVQQNGTGTTVLTAGNFYTGGTTVTGGTLQLGTLSTSGNVVGAISVNANGTLSLVNSNFSNVTSLTNDGFVNVSNASTTGPAQITNRNGVEFTDASSAGTGTIANSGLNALLRFFNTSSAAGASISNSGFVQFSDNSSAGTSTITNNQNVGFFDSSTAAAAGITNNSNGLLQFQTTSSAGGATISNTGSLDFTGSSTAANATVTNNGLLAFFTFSTAGAASISNNGDVFFSNNSSAGSASIVNNSNVQFGDNTTAGNASIVTNSGGTVLLFDNSTGGAAQFTTNAGGIVDFSGTVGPNNDGKLSAGSIAGAGSYYLGSNQLTVGSNNLDTTVSGVISDCGPTGLECDSGATGGSLVKAGSGLLTLSGANTYTGTTTIDDGVLSVTGSIVSPTFVNSGGTLMGTGSVGSTTVQNGGTLLPGNVGAPGALTMSGNLSFASGANYVLFFTPSANSKANVSGTAALDGTVFANFASGARYKAGQYTILTATGGVTGAFATLNTLGLGASSGVRNPRLAYDADDVFLVLDPTAISILSGFTGNQQGVANGINNAINGGATSNDSFNTLLSFTGTQLTNALTQLEGTTPGGATIAATQMMNGLLSLMLHPSGGPPQQTQGGSGGPIGYAAEGGFPREVAEAYAAVMPVKAPEAQISFAQRWSTWAAAFGGTAHVSGQADPGTADTNARAFAVAGGAEYKLSPSTVLGFALAGGGTSWGLSQGLGTGAGDAFQIGGYGTHNFGAAYLSGAVAYAWHDMHTDRTVTAVGTEQLHAAFRAQGFGGRIEGGYRLNTPWIGVTPYGALQVQTFHTPAYSETAQSGPGAFALSYDSRNATATRTELGAWFDKPFALAPDRVLSLRGRLAWAHDHSTEPTLNAVFQTLPGSSFTVNATAAPQDLALVSAGAELKFASNWSISAKFDGEFSGRSQSYAGTGVIKRVW
jgi:outer membrane autotransporter protein